MPITLPSLKQLHLIVDRFSKRSFKMDDNKGILTFKKDGQHYTDLVNGAYGGIVGDNMSDLIEVHLFCETNHEIERIEERFGDGKEALHNRFSTSRLEQWISRCRHDQRRGA